MNTDDEAPDADGLTEAEFLARYNPGDWQRPSVTVDIVVFAPDAGTDTEAGGNRSGKILLIKRGGHPCLGMWALPGGFVNPDETLGQAASRELREETGIDIDCKQLKQVYALSKPGRDPRTWIISVTHLAAVDARGALINPEAGDDAAEAKWFDLKLGKREGRYHLRLSNANITLAATVERDEITGEFVATENTGLAFDHAEMICYALERVDRFSD